MDGVDDKSDNGREGDFEGQRREKIMWFISENYWLNEEREWIVEDFFMKPGAWPSITFKHNIKWMGIACFTNVKMEHQIKFKNALRNATQISIMFILRYIWSEYMTLES